MHPQQKVLAKLVKHDTLALDDHKFLIDLRRSLLQMLSVIEKKLNLSRKCRNCGHALSAD